MDGSRNNKAVKFHVVMVDNHTFYASVVGKNRTLLQSVNFLQQQVPPPAGGGGDEYDDAGALCYVVVVLCIYAFSIILMIGSVIKKSKHDNGVTKYMKGMDRIRRMERREQKFKIRVAVLGRGTNSHKPPKIKLLADNMSSSVKDSVVIVTDDVKEKFEMIELTENNQEQMAALKNESSSSSSMQNSNLSNKLQETSATPTNNLSKLHFEDECKPSGCLKSSSSISISSVTGTPSKLATCYGSCTDSERITIRMDTLPEVDEEVAHV